MTSSYAEPAVWYERERRQEWEFEPPATHEWLRSLRPPPTHREASLIDLTQLRREPKVIETLASAIATAAAAGARHGVSVSPIVQANADRFSTLIPEWAPLPEISAYPDGDIAFQWHENAFAVFTVLVDENEKLHYAGLFGDSDVHGTERCSNEIPASILAGIKRVVALAQGEAA